MILEIVDEVGSTNDELIARACAGAGETALLARRQSAGRGSNGRAWAGGAGNLALSVLLRPRADAVQAGTWALLAGVAAIEGLGADDLRLKWPNDLLRDGVKLGGILVESGAGADGRIAWLVIGIGVNLAVAPALPDRATARLRTAIGAEAAAMAIMGRIAAWRETLARDGFDVLRRAWLDHAHPIGSALEVRRAGGVVEGRFAGLDAGGALLLQTAGGLLTVHSGEVALMG